MGSSFGRRNDLFLSLEKSQGKMSEILEKSGNFLRVKKWEPCNLQVQLPVALCVEFGVFKIV